MWTRRRCWNICADMDEKSEDVGLCRIRTIMSTRFCHISLNDNDLQKRDIFVASEPVSRRKTGVLSQNRPERGPRIPFEAKKGPFSYCRTQGPFSADGAELSTKARGRPSVPLSLAGPDLESPSWALLARRFPGRMGKTPCRTGKGSMAMVGDGGDRLACVTPGPTAGTK